MWNCFKNCNKGKRCQVGKAEIVQEKEVQPKLLFNLPIVEEVTSDLQLTCDICVFPQIKHLSKQKL